MQLLDLIRTREHAWTPREYAVAPTNGAKPQLGEAGRDSDSWMAGLEAGGPDVNPLLTGIAKFPVYDEMSRTDASVRSLLFMAKLPIMAAKWETEPCLVAGEPSTDPVDLLVADAVAWQFGLGGYDSPLDQSWQESLAQALLMYRYGCMGEELVWSQDLQTWVDADGDEHQLRPLVRLAPRFPQTIEKLVTGQNGRIVSLKQNLPKTQPIPAEKLAWYVFDREADWYGTSLLRAAWGPWKLKKQLMIAAGIMWDRWGPGFAKVTHPGVSTSDEERANYIGRTLRGHDAGFFTRPASPAGPDGATPAWDAEIVTTTLNDPTPLLRYYGEQIVTAGLQQFSSLGTTQTGSRAVGETLSDPFFQAVSAVADYVAQERQRQVVRRFVDYNFGPQVASPRLTFSKIQTKNLVTLADCMMKLSMAGFDLTYPGLLADIMGQFELPVPPADYAPPPVEGGALPFGGGGTPPPVVG